jgi:hypothetical protein
MLSQDALDLIGLLLSSFAVGYLIGFLNVHAHKLLDQI